MKSLKILLPFMYGLVLTSVIASTIEYIWMGARILRQSGKASTGKAAN